MNSNNQAQIYKLIDAYFDGTTTTEEERLLRQMLASPELEEDDEIRSARAVLGFTAASRCQQVKKHSQNHNRTWLAAAVMTGLSIAVGATLFMRTDTVPAGTAVIYAHGREIHNVDLALATMHSQLSDIGDAEMDGPEDAVSLLREFGESWNQ